MIFSKDAIENSKPLSEPKCAIRQGCNPYKIDIKGAFAHATISNEVKNCPACFGLGRIVEDNESKACQTPPLSKVVNNFNVAEIPAKYFEASVEKFSNFSGNGKQVLKQINQWKDQFQPLKSKGLVVTGPVGVGKSYLMACLAKYFVEKGYSVKCADFFQLLSDLRAGYSNGQSEATLLAPLIKVDILLIDELGKGRNKDFELTILDQLVSERYKQNKSIVASTNYQLSSKGGAHNFNYDLDSAYGGGSDFSPDTFGELQARVGSRIFSRLKEMTHFVELSGTDMREGFSKT